MIAIISIKTRMVIAKRIQHPIVANEVTKLATWGSSKFIIYIPLILNSSLMLNGVKLSL
jgi:hypothetical protein